MSNDTAIGAAYVTTGVIGMSENFITAYFMATDPKMRNPTYFYMICLAISDAISFAPIALYAGVTTLDPGLIDPVSMRLASLANICSWYAGCTLMVLASFSRYVQLVMPEKGHVYFRRRKLIISLILCWIMPSIIFGWAVRLDPIPYGYVPERYMWVFQSGDSVAIGSEMFTFVMCIGFSCLMHAFNIKSMRHIRQLRQQAQMVETSRNFKREVKLFVQCAVSGTVYTFGTVLYFITSALEKNGMPYFGVVIQAIWYCNNLQNPIIYFIVNSRLRRRILNVFCCRKNRTRSTPTTN